MKINIHSGIMEKINRNLIYSLFLILFFASCKMGPNYQRSEVASPTSYRFDSFSTEADSVLNLKWWELFGDEELQQLITTALNNNYNVLTAAARIEEARAALGYNKADLYPSIGYDASAGRTNLLGNQTTDPMNSFFIAPGLNWEIDFWGKYRRSTEAARAELLATQYGYRAIQTSLIAEVAGTYFLLLDYRARLEIAEQTVLSRKESMRIIGERFDKGIVPEIDYNQAEIQEAIAAAAVPIYVRAVGQTENALSILLGQSPNEFQLKNALTDAAVPPEIPAGIPSTILERRPDIMQAEQMLAAQTARIGVAQAMRFPSISITGFLGVASPQLNTLVSGDAMAWSAGASLLGPIFNFGKNKRRVEIERQRMVQDSLQYVQSVLQAFREVEDALLEVSTYRDEVDARFRQREAATNANILSRSRYDGGVTSYLEVLDSERSLFNAELAAAEVYQQQLRAYVKLYKVLGGGWISEEESKQAAENDGQ